MIKMTLMRAASLLAIGCASALSANAAVPVGHLAFVAGKVSAIGADGQSRLLKKGSDIAPGETIDTGDGRAQVRFSDGAFVALQPQSQFRVDDYVFNGKSDGKERSLFSLLKGGLRTITGAIGKRNRAAYQITTAVATIGVRGTEYAIQYGNSITGSVGEGAIEVCNSAGCLDVANGEAFYVASKDTRPVLTKKKAELPPTQPLANLAGYQACANSGDCLPVPATLSQPTAFVGTQLVSIAGVQGSTTDKLSNPMQAQFANDGTLQQFPDPLVPSTILTTFDSVTPGDSDGIITWGVGHFLGDGGTVDYHYVAGRATPLGDMLALGLSNAVATYRMIGATNPSVVDAIGMQVAGATAQTPTAFDVSLSANFGAATVEASVGFASSVGSGTWQASGAVQGNTFGLTTTSCTGNTGTCTGSGAGIFTGANAKDAGFVYSITPADQAASITGAVALTKR